MWIDAGAVVPGKASMQMAQIRKRIVAVIPARGGSKGIPRKNLQPVCGKPLVVHSIEQALAVPEIDRVIVSTDDREIEKVASAAGADVVERPRELSDDEAPSESAILHVLDHLREADEEPDVVVFLQATSPNRTSRDIREALDTFTREDADSLFSACEIHGFVWRITDDGPESLSYDFRNRKRRQDCPSDVVENGSIYIFKTQILRTTGNRLGGRVAVFLMGPESYIQVDEPADLQLISKLMPHQADRRLAASAELNAVKLLVLDFDGVLTDNSVLVDGDGREMVRCDRGDGLGLADLRRQAIAVSVLSSEKNPVVSARCQKLGVPCRQGLESKIDALKGLAAEFSVAPDAIAYVGNDMNDVECLRWSGIGIAVHDADPAAKAAAQWVTGRPGGHGAVREVCEAILESKGISCDERSSHW